MAMYWDKERVAVEIIDDEKYSDQDKYPNGTLIFYVGANQVEEDDLLECLRRLLIERGLRASGAGDFEEAGDSETEDKLWEAELKLAHNLMDDAGAVRTPGDKGDYKPEEDDDIDLKLEDYMAGLGMYGGYPFIADDLAAKQVIIHDCEHVSIG